MPVFQSGVRNTQASPEEPVLVFGTTTAAAQAITYDTPIVGIKHIRVVVIGRVTQSGTGTVGDAFIAVRELAVKNVAGIISLIGAIASLVTASDAGMSTVTVAFSAVGGNGRLTVTAPAAAGEGATPNIDWSAFVEFRNC